MSDNRMDNNRVNVTGKICSGFRYSHQIYGEGFYVADICISRESGYTDIIPRGWYRHWSLDYGTVY